MSSKDAVMSNRVKIRASALLLWVLIAGCTESAVPDRPLGLQEIGRFGVDTIPETGIPPRVRDVGGGVLADVAGVVSDSTGAVFILDRDWKKIAVFAPDGAFRGVIFGGLGEGPGEFRLPVHMASAGSRLLSVLDYELRRISLFDPQGDLQRTIALDGGGMLRHVVVGDTILVTGHGAGDAPYVRIFDRDGNMTSPGPSQTPEDEAFGAPIGLARGRTVRALVSSRRPGVWMQLAQGEWSRTGDPLFTEMAAREAQVVDGMLAEIPAQAEAYSIAEMSDGFIVQGYHLFDRPFTWEDPPSREEMTHYLALFRGDGQHVGTVSLPPGVNAGCLYVQPTTDHLFLCTEEPFPQVIEYELLR